MIDNLEKMINWKDRISHVKEFVSSVTFPVYTSKDGQNFELFGSSVAVEVRGDKYLCTAEHLMRSVLDQRSPCVIGAIGRFEEVNLTRALRITSDSIDIDLCLVKLKNECPDIPFLSLHSFADREVLEESSWQYLQGYPLSKNKRKKLHDHKNKQIRVEYLKLAVSVDESIMSPIKRANHGSHLFFNYDKTVYQSESKNDVELRNSQNNTSLKSLSGSGLWNVHGDPISPSIELIGIFNTFKSRIGIATKSKYLVGSKISGVLGNK